MAIIYKVSPDAENKGMNRLSNMFNAMGLELVVTQEIRKNRLYIAGTTYVVETNKPTWLLSKMNLAHPGSMDFEQAHNLGTSDALESAAFVSVRSSLEEAFRDLDSKLKTTSKHDYVAIESTPGSGEYDLWKYDDKADMPVKIGAKVTVAKPQV